MSSENLTIDQVRDEVVRLLGWVRLTHPDPVMQAMCEREAGGPCWGHPTLRPHPSNQPPLPTTVDGIAALMPKGWSSSLTIDCGVTATAWHYINKQMEGYGMDNAIHECAEKEYDARLRLLHRVLTIMAETK